MKVVAKKASTLLGLTTEQLRSLLDKLDQRARKHSGPQKRRSPRLPFRSVNVRVQILDEQRTGDAGFRVVTRNLSLHGMAFLVDRPLPLGQILRIEITFRKDYVVPMQAKVARCQEIGGKVHEVGVEFVPSFGIQTPPLDGADEHSSPRSLPGDVPEPR